MKRTHAIQMIKKAVINNKVKDLTVDVFADAGISIDESFIRFIGTVAPLELLYASTQKSVKEDPTFTVTGKELLNDLKDILDN